SVPEARRAQDQPRGLEDGDTAFSECLRWDVFQTGHGRLLGFNRCSSNSTSKAVRKTLRGSRHPVSPSWNLVEGPRRFGLNAGGPPMCPPVYSAAASVIGTTETKVRFLAFVRYSTRPSISANSVWSTPTPTFGPACHCVPR